MLTASLITVVSSLLLVNAQTNPQIETESIAAQFQNAYLVPDLISTFNPDGFLTVNFGGQAVAPGTPLAVADVQNQPTVTFTAANSSVTPGNTFTLAMVDPGAIGVLSTPGPTRHWLVNNVTIGSGGALTIPASAQAITAYGAPLPAATDPPHRYAILLWQQPASFAPTGDLATPGQPITQFDLNSYVTSSGLGPVVAGWYFTCTTGTATAATSTQAVNTATLPGANSSGGSSGASGTHSGSSPSATHTGAASSLTVAPVSILSVLAAAAFGIVVA